MYLLSNNFILRMPITSIDTYIDMLSSSDKQQFVEKVLRNSMLRKALSIASISFDNELKKIEEGKPITGKFFSSLMAYVSRAASRSTPFGIFAGVGYGEFSNSNNIVINSIETHANPDSEWLYKVIKSLERDRGVLKQLRVVKNPNCYKLNDRYKNLLLTEQINGLNCANIRCSNQIQRVLNFTNEPIAYSRLKECILDGSDTPDHVIDNFLYGLIDNEFLLTELRSVFVCSSSLKRLIEILEHTNSIEQLDYFKKLHSLCEKLNCSAEDFQLADCYSLRHEMASIVEHSSYLNVYLTLNFQQASLPLVIRNTIIDLLDFLVICLPSHELSYIQQFKTKFIERYGTNTEVSICELCDDSIGLGDQFVNITKNFDNPNVSFVRKRVENKMVEAIKNRLPYIEIDETDINLFRKHLKHTEIALPPSLEVFFTVSYDNMDHPTLHVATNPGSKLAYSSINRFYPETEEHISASYKKVEELSRDSYIYLDARELHSNTKLNNVSCGKFNLNNNLLLNIFDEKGESISLNDLFVGYDLSTDRFYIKSHSKNKEVNVVSDNMINPTLNSQPIKLLRLISDAYEQNPLMSLNSFRSFSFKYMPEIRYHNIVLSEEYWLLEFTDFDNLSESFDEYFLKYRNVWGIPQFVYATLFDQKILLDLANRLCIEFLSRELMIKGSNIRLEKFEHSDIKAIPTSVDGARFVTEYVAQLHLDDSSNVFKFNTANGIKLFESSFDRSRSFQPNSTWLYLKIYVSEINLDKLIDQFDRFFHDLLLCNLADKYYFVRYSDPDLHLRIRIHHGDNFEELFSALFAWYDVIKYKVNATKITIDTFDREVERYGGLALMEAAENVFYCDSILTAKLIQCDRSNDELLCQTSILDYISIFHQEISEQYSVLVNFDKDEKFKKEFQRKKQKYMAVRKNSKQEIIMNETISDLYNLRIKSLQGYRQLFLSQKEVTNTLDNIVLSMIHMHLNRLKSKRDFEYRMMAITKYLLDSEVKKVKFYRTKEVET